MKLINLALAVFIASGIAVEQLPWDDHPETWKDQIRRMHARDMSIPPTAEEGDGMLTELGGGQKPTTCEKFCAVNKWLCQFCTKTK